jgi:hypothetical protein
MYAIDRFAYAAHAGGSWEGYDMAALLDSVKFCIIPMVNPDGVNLVQNGLAAVGDPDCVAGMYLPGGPYGYRTWKANINGVDLNRNYGVGWKNEVAGENPRGYSGYGGDEPASEPETKAVSEYILSGNFEAFLSFHAQGQVFYYAEADDRQTRANRLVGQATGFRQLSSGVDPDGTWFGFVRHHFGKATMTVELCDYVGPYPYPDGSFDRAWRPARNILPVFAQAFSQNVGAESISARP